MRTPSNRNMEPDRGGGRYETRGIFPKCRRCGSVKRVPWHPDWVRLPDGTWSHDCDAGIMDDETVVIEDEILGDEGS